MTKTRKLNKLQIGILSIILLMAFGARLYKVNSPIADWHSFRQADTAAVTRNFIKLGVNPFVPIFDDLSNIASGKDNPRGYRMVEFPLYNLVHLTVYKLLPFWNLETAGRLTTAMLSILGLWWLFKIVNKFSGFRVAIATLGVAAFMPYSIYYSRVILPDPFMVTLAMGASWHLILAESKSKKQERYLNRIISMLLMSGALLVKPTAIFFLGALLLWLLANYKLAILKHWLWISAYIAVAIAPLAWWRFIWIVRFPEGIAVNTWLLNSNHIRGKGAWWRWLFEVRVGTLMLGVWGVALMVLGMVQKIRKEDAWYWSLSVSMFAYLLIFATGNVQHDYYQILLIPVVSIFVAKGLNWLYINAQNTMLVSVIIGLACLGMGFAFSWYDIRGYYQINNPSIVEAGKFTDLRIPKDAKVIAPYGGDTAFLYQTNRQGWAAVTEPISTYLKNGATHYVSVKYDALTKQLEREYQVDTANEKFIIIQLTKPKEPTK